MASDWLADLNRAFKRHRGGRPGWLLQQHRERLRLLSAELPPRPGEPPGRTVLKRAITLNTPPGPATGLQALSEAAAI